MEERNNTAAAMTFAITRAKQRGAAEVSTADMLLGALQAMSRFGIVQLGEMAIDLESFGVDWLGKPPTNGHKVSYSDEAVRVLDRAAGIAYADGAGKVEISHLLAALASEDNDVMRELIERCGVTGATLRIAAARLVTPAESSAAPSSPQPASQSREYLSPEDAALELGIHVQTVRAYVRSGKLPALRLAGERAIRIRRQDLHQLLEPLQPDH
jgi:excisionase family DNA binding protein